MPSINDDVDYSGFLPGITDKPKQGSAPESKGRRKKKNKKKLILRHPLNVRIDDDLRKRFVSLCESREIPQHVLLEEALWKTVKKYEKC